jgi:methionyl aminopeptidase
MRGAKASARVPIHGEAGFAAMRAAGRLAAQTLDMIGAHVRPGVTTGELDRLCHDFMVARGATPGTLGYKGYRWSSCISVNHVVCHGVPGPRALAEGDIVNIDVTPLLDGWYGDASRMYAVGVVSLKARRLMAAAEAALMAGLAAVRPGATLGDIGWAIQQVAAAERFSVVEAFCGHGVGRVFHDAPDVLHVGRPGEGLVLREGMFFTVEPILNAGRPEVKLLADGWTPVSRDRSLSAQVEHSVGVTATGCEIFTLSPAAA